MQELSDKQIRCFTDKFVDAITKNNSIVSDLFREITNYFDINDNGLQPDKIIEVIEEGDQDFKELSRRLLFDSICNKKIK